MCYSVKIKRLEKKFLLNLIIDLYKTQKNYKKKEVVNTKYVETLVKDGLVETPFEVGLKQSYRIKIKGYVEPHDMPITWTNHKATISGNIIEVMEYEYPVFQGFKSNSTGKKENGEKRLNNIQKTEKMLRRLINSNVTETSKFLTLTYSDNQVDLKQAKTDFKRFIERLKRNYKLVPSYVYVTEFQKRGAVHFHVIFNNLPYIPSKELSRLWGHGFIKINRITKVDNVGAYICKYMTKSVDDERLQNSDLYGRSRGLKEPIEVDGQKEIQLLQELYSDNEVYNSSYDSQHFGRVSYTQYNLLRNKNQEV